MTSEFDDLLGGLDDFYKMPKEKQLGEKSRVVSSSENKEAEAGLMLDHVVAFAGVMRIPENIVNPARFFLDQLALFKDNYGFKLRKLGNYKAADLLESLSANDCMTQFEKFRVDSEHKMGKLDLQDPHYKQKRDQWDRRGLLGSAYQDC